jgi:hypothetical protein
MFATHALTTAIWGEGMWPIRISEALTVLVVGWLMAAAARPKGKPAKDGEMGLGALVFSGLYYTFFDYWDTAHPELWESAFTLAGWVAALRARTPWRRDAGTGALATAAFMFKYPAGLPALGMAALCAVRAVRERPAGQNPIVALLLAGARTLCGVLPVVFLCVLPFWIGGKLGPMWEILGVYILHYAEQAPALGGVPQWLRIEHGGALLITSFVLSAVTLALARERKDRDAEWRLGWLVLAAILALGSVVLQGRYFTYHFVATGCFWGVLCVLGLRELSHKRGNGPSWRQLGIVLAVIGLAFYAGPRWTSGRNQSYAKFTKDLIAYRRGKLSVEQLYAPFVGRRPLDGVVASMRVAKKLNELKRPGDTLCTRGFLTPLYPRTGMRCTTRHLVEDNVGPGLPDWKREYKDTLERHPPTFLVTFSDRPRDIAYLKSRGYKQAAREGMFVIMSTRETTPATLTAPTVVKPSGS